MKNIRSIDDLTPEQQEEMFFAMKKEPTAFVQMTEEAVILTAEGGIRIDNWQHYYVAFGNNGDAWPVSHEYFEKNYVEMDYISQQFMNKSFLKGNK